MTGTVKQVADQFCMLRVNLSYHWKRSTFVHFWLWVK